MRGYLGIARMIALAGVALTLAGSAVTAADPASHTQGTTTSSYHIVPDDRTSPPRVVAPRRLHVRSALFSAPGEGASPPTLPRATPARAVRSTSLSAVRTVRAANVSAHGATTRRTTAAVATRHVAPLAAATPVIDRAAQAALVARLTHTPVLPSYQTYVTRPGDTMESIARRFHDVAWLIRRRNGGLWQPAPGTRIAVLRWPFDAPHWTTLTTRTDRPQTYTIQPGDSLWSIAGKLHTDTHTLASENGIGDGATIYAGQQVVLHHYTLHQQRVWVPGVPSSNLSTGLLLTDMANLVGTDAALIKGLAWHESGWRMVTGASGEIGMVQIMPQTARWVERNLLGYTLDPRVPTNNALIGTTLLAYYLDINHHDTHKALALYHSGNMQANRRNGDYIRAVLALRTYFYHHPRVGF